MLVPMYRFYRAVIFFSVLVFRRAGPGCPRFMPAETWDLAWGFWKKWKDGSDGI